MSGHTQAADRGTTQAALRGMTQAEKMTFPVPVYKIVQFDLATHTLDWGANTVGPIIARNGCVYQLDFAAKTIRRYDAYATLTELTWTEDYGALYPHGAPAQVFLMTDLVGMVKCRQGVIVFDADMSGYTARDLEWFIQTGPYASYYSIPASANRNHFYSRDDTRQKIMIHDPAYAGTFEILADYTIPFNPTYSGWNRSGFVIGAGDTAWELWYDWDTAWTPPPAEPYVVQYRTIALTLSVGGITKTVDSVIGAGWSVPVPAFPGEGYRHPCGTSRIVCQDHTYNRDPSPDEYGYSLWDENWGLVVRKEGSQSAAIPDIGSDARYVDAARNVYDVETLMKTGTLSMAQISDSRYADMDDDHAWYAARQ